MSSAVIVLFMITAICLVIRMPVSFSLLTASTIWMLLVMPKGLGQVFTIVTENMMSAEVWLALPLYILLANLLHEVKVLKRVFAFCRILPGRMTDAAAEFNVCNSLFFTPCILMVIYAKLSGVSIRKLLLNGVIPVILLLCLLLIYAGIRSKKREIPSDPAQTFHPGTLKNIIIKSASDTTSLALLAAASYLFAWIIAREQLPQKIVSAAAGVSDHKYLLLLVISIAFLLLGCLLDAAAVLLIFVPMVLPLVSAVGIDPVHFGVLLCLDMMIALAVSPFGRRNSVNQPAA